MSATVRILRLSIKGRNQNIAALSTKSITYSIIAISVLSILALFPEFSEAATNASQGAVAGEAELNSALSNIKSLVSGVVGKIITIVALGFGLAGSIFKFNPVAIAGSFGVALTAAFGPSAVMAVVGATF
jgi:hypothetical protein